MTELAVADACVVFALGRESGPFRREFAPQQRFPGAPCWARFCGPAWLSVLVLETGVGAQRSEAAIRWLLDRPRLGNLPYRPKVVVSAGFAGALQDGYQVGDVIVATEVANAANNRWPTTWPGELQGEWRPTLHRGRLVTVGRLVCDPEQKRSLGQEHEAIAADMESATIAALCTRHGVPFGCVRVISDDVTTALAPALVALLTGGRASPLRVLAALARSPRLAVELWRLARQTRLAAQRLGEALGELLTLTLPWSAELEGQGG